MAENIVELLTDVADAIREKKGSNEPINAQNFANEIKNLPSGSAPRWTGHADAEGLKAIGWDDDDIAYYQQYGVNWNEEEDEYHLVSDDNKALYGVLDTNNISTYRDRIVYLPKLKADKNTSWSSRFANCKRLVAIPILDSSKVTDMTAAFNGCPSLSCLPPLDTRNVISMRMMCYQCYSLQHFPQLDTSNVTSMYGLVSNARRLTEFPIIDTSKVTDMGEMFAGTDLRYIPALDFSNVKIMNTLFNKCYELIKFSASNLLKVENMDSMFRDCWQLKEVQIDNTPQLANIGLLLYFCPSLERLKIDITSATTYNSPITAAYNVRVAEIKGLKFSMSFSESTLLEKDSLLYIINNEAATEPITITLHSYAYTRLAEDADVVAALANHPNVSLAK